MLDLISQVTYCGMIQVDCVDKVWKIADTCLTVTHGENKKFDWKIMKN